jgi:glucose/arabinose dehydrogenase
VKTPEALGEVWAYGIRNMQRFGWDPKTGAMYMSDIGQNIVEEVSPISAGANLGWNIWEGSYRFISRQAVSTEAPRSDPKMVYPIVEWDQFDPILPANNAASSVGVIVYRSTTIPQLTNRLLFGEMPVGELFHVSADNPPNGGQDAIRRVLFVTSPGTAPRTFLEIIQEKNKAQGKTPAARADLRFDANAAGQIFLLNKADGTLMVIEK